MASPLLDEEGGCNVAEQRDDVAVVPNTRVHVLQSQIVAMKDEILQRDSAYRQRRALLEQGVKEYDDQFQVESEIYQRKLTAMMKETEWHDVQFKSELATLKETWQRKFEDLQIFTEASLEREREERAAVFQEIDEQLMVRDNDVDGLLDLISKQGDELKQAKLEREELKQEMKNILMTLHVQFEHIVGVSSKQADELTTLREEHSYVKEKLDRHATELGTYVDSVQYEVSEVQKEAKNAFQKTTAELEAIREAIGEKDQAKWNAQHEALEYQVQRQGNALEAVVAEVKTVRHEQDDSRRLQDKIDWRLSKTEDKLKFVQVDLSECDGAIKELSSTVRKEAVESMQGWLSEKDKIAGQLQFQSDQIKKTNIELITVNIRCDALKRDAEAVEANWKKALDTLEDQVREQGADLSSTMNDLAGVKHDVQTVEVQLSTGLKNLATKLQLNAELQATVNANLLNEQDEHKENLKTTELNVEMSNDQLKDLLRKVTHQAENLETLKLNLMKTLEKNELGLNEYQKKFEAWNSKLEGIVKMMQHRAEAHVLATKDFKAKQDEMDQKVKSCEYKFDALECRVGQAEGSITNAGSPELIEMMIQPWQKQQESLGDVLKKQAEDLKTLKEDLRVTNKSRVTVIEKVDTMNKTWESLFQHLVCQVKKDTMDVLSTRSESEKVLKDMTILVSSWENQLKQLSTEQKSSKKELTTALQSNRLGMDSLQTKMESYDTRLSDLAGHLMDHMASQSSQEEQQARQEEKLGLLKVELDSKVEEQLKAQQKEVENQVAKIAVRTETTIESWTAVFAKHVSQAQQDTAQLRTAIADFKETTNAREQSVDVDRKVGQWQNKFHRILEQAKRQSIELKEANEESAIEKKTGEFSIVGNPLVLTNKSLHESKYESRILGHQVRGLTSGEVKEPVDKLHDPYPVELSDPNDCHEERRE